MSKLDEIRKMPEHLLKDDDHPFLKDIPKEEAIEALNESYEQTKYVFCTEFSQEERESRSRMILEAMNCANC